MAINGWKTFSLMQVATDDSYASDIFSGLDSNGTISFNVNKGGVTNQGPDTLECYLIFDHNNISSLNRINICELNIDSITCQNKNPLSTEEANVTVDIGVYFIEDEKFLLDATFASNEELTERNFTHTWTEGSISDDTFNFYETTALVAEQYNISDGWYPACKLTIQSNKSNVCAAFNMSDITLDVCILDAQYYIVFRDDDGTELARFAAYDQSAELDAYIPQKPGYRFAGWTNGTTTYADSASVPGHSRSDEYGTDLYYTAVWERADLVIDATASPEGAATITGTGTHGYGKSFNLTATASAGYILSSVRCYNDGALFINFTAAECYTNGLVDSEFKNFSIPYTVGDTNAGKTHVWEFIFELEPGTNIYLGNAQMDVYVGTTLVDVYVGNTLI